MKRWTRWGVWAMTAALIGGGIDLAPVRAEDEPTPLPILSDRPDADQMLGPVFSSESAGVSFRPPAGGKLIRRQVADEVVQYINEARNWSLIVTRTQFRDPVSLREYRDTSGQLRSGMLAMTLEQFMRQQPGAKLLRENYVKIGDVEAGLLALRYTLGTSRKISQQAVFQGNDLLYYTFNFITPAANTEEGDAGEKEAADVFRQMVDSVRILDRAAIKRDQDERLYRTRTFFVNLSADRIRQAMIPQQWLRLMRDGKDIGYTFAVEEPSANRADEIRIGMRSRTAPEPNVRVEAESWLTTTLDRRHESWTNAVVIDKDGQRDFMTEFGVSNVETERVLDDRLRTGTADDPQQPPVRQREIHTLEVSYVAKRTAHPPIKREVPVFYIPQAIGQMLPRLLPLKEPKGYLFAVWVADRKEVMARYVDVMPARDVVFGGKKQTVVPIKDRIGLEGSPTFHYMSLDGHYLGSESKESGVMILPTDEATLLNIWKDADLTRPAPAPAAQK